MVARKGSPTLGDDPGVLVAPQGARVLSERVHPRTSALPAHTHRGRRRPGRPGDVWMCEPGAGLRAARRDTLRDARDRPGPDHVGAGPDLLGPLVDDDA